MHPGLLLDKPAKKDWWRSEDSGYVRARLEAVCQARGDAELLKRLGERRRLALGDAKRFQGKTAGAMSLHLARANAFENAGLCLHPLYGFAYLPGSGLKGMARAFATLAGEPPEVIEEVFGPAVTSDTDACAGAVVFHDAWPVQWPKLAVDIVNCHHRHYYDDTTERFPPEDWEDPVPVNFLTVQPGTEFEFAVSPRQAGNTRHVELCAKAVCWLQSALVHLGAGAKTNAGYGRFRIKGVKPPGLPQRAVFEAKLTLVTPAFLAGALQRAEDCDLRPATVRGLLRWWWRALHSGSVPVTELRRLERMLWGATESSGAIALEVERISGTAPVTFRVEEICGQYRIPRVAKDEKRSQGLLYLAYGMQEGRRKGRVVKPPRQYLPAGCAWRIRIIARACYDSGRQKKWEPEEVLAQARAALLALVELGGIGAKARRGYGSMAIECDPPAPKGVDAILGAAGSFGNATPVKLYSPSLRRLAGGRVLEEKLAGKEPWFVLDQLGAAYQEVAAAARHQKDKLALGLPRKINNPKGNEFIDHPRRKSVPGGTQKKKPGEFRHASPLHFKVFQRDGDYWVRLTPFVDPYLPDEGESERFVVAAIASLVKKLEERAKTQSSGCARCGAAGGRCPTTGESEGG